MTNETLTDRLPAAVPLWREGLAVVEWGLLRYSPVYWGVGVPRGDGSAVIPIPGFTGTDGYLYEMRGWLRRIGYHPFSSGIGRNADCLDLLSQRLLETIRAAADETGRTVHLVGHSLGGVLARGVATIEPSLVASVVTMGSPIRGVRSHPLVLRVGEAVRDRIQDDRSGAVHPECFGGECDCAFMAATSEPFPESVPELAVFTRQDGVVAWRYSRHSVPHKDAEVIGTHSGLAFNPAAYRAIADFLARTGTSPLR
ncbi:MAG: alpha/beta fold hydrolase [Thermoanaerobaculia bacterium]|nr:alpha/beta fold hydrolase [Thermoanaerobaculia bacterium]